MIDPEHHADDRNMVESILRHIPGFRGYLEKEYRRESDHLARTWMADQLQRCKAGIDDLQRTLVETAQIDALPRLERIRTRLDTLQSRLRGAVRGYSGFFDFVKVDQQRLDRVYRHDMAMIIEIEELVQQVEERKSDDTVHAAESILTLVESLHRQLDERSAILQGLSEKE